jgi:hypothetical protein
MWTVLGMRNCITCLRWARPLVQSVVQGCSKIRHVRKSIPTCSVILLLCIQLASQTRDLRVEPISPAEQRAFEKQVKVALVVGISAYPQGSGLSSLKYAARDAEVLGAALKSQGYLVRQLTESDATRAMIRRTLRELSDAVSPDEGTILFFFGGHGFTYKGTNSLATFGVTADDLDGEGLAVKDVEELLRASKAKRKLLFVDACRNDPGQAARSTEQRSFSKLQTSEGMRVLFSTKEGRVSFEDDALRQGVFTYFLAKGLQGEAAGADGLVTFRDLADYVTDRMRAYTVERGQVQIPFEAGESSGDFLLSAGAKGGGLPPATPLPVVPREPEKMAPLSVAPPATKVNEKEQPVIAFVTRVRHNNQGTFTVSPDAVSWAERSGKGKSNFGFTCESLDATRRVNWTWYEQGYDYGAGRIKGQVTGESRIPTASQFWAAAPQVHIRSGFVLESIGFKFASGEKQEPFETTPEEVRKLSKAVGRMCAPKQP